MKCIEDEIPFEIPESWEWCRLSMVGTTNIGLTYKPTEVKESGTIVFRSCNIKNGKINFTDLVRVQADIRENQYIYENDILMCARNGSRSLVGKCAIIQNLTEVASFGAFMAVFHSICNQYIYYYFNTYLFRSTFDNDDSKQINQVTQAILRDALIPLPPFAEQTRIITKLHEILSLVDFVNDGTKPSSWIWCRGYSCFSGMETRSPNGDFFKYIDIDSIDNKLHKIKYPKVIATKDAPSRANRGVQTGSVLFAFVRPYLENIAYVDEQNKECIASTGFYVCNSNGALYPLFMYYLMISEYVVQGLNQFMKGDNSPSISKGNIENWLYPIPPSNEQKRIYSKLEELIELTLTVEKSLS